MSKSEFLLNFEWPNDKSRPNIWMGMHQVVSLWLATRPSFLSNMRDSANDG